MVDFTCPVGATGLAADVESVASADCVGVRALVSLSSVLLPLVVVVTGKNVSSVWMLSPFDRSSLTSSAVAIAEEVL